MSTYEVITDTGVESACSSTLAQVQALEKSYGAANYDSLPIVLSHGQGALLWDSAGKRYVDMMSAYSAVSHGHCHPRLVEVLLAQAQRLSICSRAFYSEKLAPFLKRACELTGMDRALPMNTGVEAVETAIKAARKWAYTVKGVAQDQAEILLASQNPQQLGYWFISLVLASLLATLTLLFAVPLQRLLGAKVIGAFERLMGMILTTIAVQMFLSGLTLYFKSVT